MRGRASAQATQRRVPRRGAILLLALLSLCVGCSNRDPAALNEDDSSDTARTVAERGPVKLTIEVSPAKPRLSDEPILTVTIEAENGIDIQSPPFGGSLGDFIIRDFYEPVPEITADRQLIRQIYTLEPESSGEVSVAPITVSFVDRRDSDKVTEHTISSDEFTIEVTTIVGDAIPSLGELRPAAPPVALPEDSGLSSGWLAFIGFVPLVAVFAWWWRRRRRSPVQTPEISPRERGLQELEDLIRSGLAARDIKVFYVELTAVVRRYIERSSGIRAPEQTTEEFLRAIADSDRFSQPEKQGLQTFLESADLVKFAGQTPTHEEISASQDRAREFIVVERALEEEAGA